MIAGLGLKLEELLCLELIITNKKFSTLLHSLSGEFSGELADTLNSSLGVSVKPQESI